MKINTHILGLLVVVGLFSLQSCDDESYDIEGSNQNYVYINVNRWTSIEYPQNTFVYEVLRTPIGSSLESGPEIVKVGVRSTKVASKDITVTLDIQSPNQKIPDRKTKCVIKTHINIKQNVIFSAKLKPV